MRSVLYLIGLLLLFLINGCTTEDEEEFYIWCSCRLDKKPISCSFYAFPEDDYTEVIEDDEFGVAYATNAKGEKIKNIGRAYYNTFGDSFFYDKLEWTNPSSINDLYITEGTFYIACFPLKTGDRHPYKAKIFTKTKDKGLSVQPIFTYDSYSCDEGYYFFEWEE